MSTVLMKGPIAIAWPRLTANIAGFCYLLAMLASGVAVVIDGRMLIRADGAAVVANILAHEPLFRLSLASNLVATAFSIAVTVLLYGLLRPVDGRLSILAAFLSGEACLVGGLASLLHLAPLVVVKGAQWLGMLDVEPIRALILRLLGLTAQGAFTGMLFFGLYSLLIGYLVFKSAFLPRVLGVLTVVAGFAWITGSVVSLVSLPQLLAFSS